MADSQDSDSALVSNPTRRRSLGDLIDRRLQSRRKTLKQLAVLAAATTARRADAAPRAKSTLTFPELKKTLDDKMHLADGYTAKVLLRWGDPVLEGAPPFDPRNQSLETQERQFGYNCDFIAYFPLPGGSSNSDHGLLTVNHEYTNADLMFPGLTPTNVNEKMDKSRVEIETAAHGISVVEVKKVAGEWRVVPNSKFRRRLTAYSPITLTGPAAGSDRLKTASDPTGRHVLGTLNNCAGGVTPWGTMLSGEENFPLYFIGDSQKTDEKRNHRRYGVMAGEARWAWWGKHLDRFNVEKEPNEPNRFGWVVEVDPFDPTSTPIKRTALGRLRHEGATCAQTPDGRVVVYTADDQASEYVYRFVSDGRFQPNDRRANKDLLDKGVLSVAHFEEDGTAKWLPLVHGVGPLTPANGFENQGDVLIETRRAADLVGGTPMDRPEDIEVSPKSGKVYIAMTNNVTRDKVQPGSPREKNRFGHIVELTPPSRDGAVDHAAETFAWDLFLMAGNPAWKDSGARYHPEVTADGWLSGPDNAAFDHQGRLWIATDEAAKYAKIANGVYACDADGPARALTKLFFAAPNGAEICGPYFTPDDQTLFLSIQHPGEDPGSTFDNPSTRWPDFDPMTPPRPAIVAITKVGGGPIG